MRTDRLVLDDWGLYPPYAQGAREIIEIIEDRSGSGSTMITSPIRVADWFDGIAAPTIADAILDRLVGALQVIGITETPDRIPPKQLIAIAEIRN